MGKFLSIAMGVVLLGFANNIEAKDALLTGTVMGSSSSQAANAFDSKSSTYFKGTTPYSYSYVRNWVGLDLGEKHVISKVGLMPANGHSADCRFAVVQGANEADFSDALPLMVFKDEPTAQTFNYADIDVSRGFRYIRVMATNSAGYFAEIEIYGAPGEGDNSHFYQMTNLPLVSFNTPGDAQILSKDDKHPGSYVAIVSENGTKLLEDNQAQMKGRGNGSWTFPKKPFQIKFNKKQQPLDAPAKAKKWTLINNYGDRTLMRNKIAFDMSRMAGMAYTPYCTFVDVIYNGSYEGAYQLSDQVEVNPGRVEITEMATTDISGEALTGGYFLEIDAYADQEVSWFKSNKGIPVTIKSPEDDAITSEQSTYITDYFNKFEAALFGSNHTDPEKGYRKYLDLESFLRYFILCELNGNVDSWWSTYLWKERGDEKFHVGPVWDVDLGFQNVGNYRQVYEIDNLTDYIYTCPKASLASSAMLTFVSQIVKNDPEAMKLMSEIWSDLRYNHNFNAEYFNAKIDEYAQLLDESQRLNFVRWPILNQSVQKDQKIWGSYEGEVGNVKDYLTKRVPRLDQFIGLLDPPVPDPEILYVDDFEKAALGALPIGWTASAETSAFSTVEASDYGIEAFSGERVVAVDFDDAKADNAVSTPRIPLAKDERCIFSVMAQTIAKSSPATIALTAESTNGKTIELQKFESMEFGDWTELRGEFTPETEDAWKFAVTVNGKDVYMLVDDATVRGVIGTTQLDDNQTLTVPSLETFDNAADYMFTTSLPANWTSTGTTPFAVASVKNLKATSENYYLVAENSETGLSTELKSPAYKLEAETSYYLTFNVAANEEADNLVKFGALNQSTNEFTTLDTKVVELEDVDNWTQRAVYFIPSESADYIFTWNVEADNEGSFVALDDFSIIEKVEIFKPTAAFAADHTYVADNNDLAVFDGHSVEFVNATVGADECEWSVQPSANISIAENGNAIIGFTAEGEYDVTLTATNEAGSDEVSHRFNVAFFDREKLRDIALANRGEADELLSGDSVPTFETSSHDYVTGPNHYYRTFAQLVKLPADHNLKLMKVVLSNTDLEYKRVEDSFTHQHSQPFAVEIYGVAEGCPDQSHILGSVNGTMAELLGTSSVTSTEGSRVELTFSERIPLEGDIYVVVKFSDDFDIDAPQVGANASHAAFAALRRPMNSSTLMVLPTLVPESGNAKIGEWCNVASVDPSMESIALNVELWTTHNNNKSELTLTDVDGQIAFGATYADGKVAVSGLATGDCVVVSDILGRVIAKGVAVDHNLMIDLPAGTHGVVTVAASAGTRKLIVK